MTTDLVAEFEKHYPSGPRIVGRILVASGSFTIVVLFGPSGSGKTTVLRCLAGLETPEHGFIRFGAESWFDSRGRICLPPQQRDIGYLSQDYALFPHLTIADNIAYGLRDLTPAQRHQRVDELLDLFELVGLDRRYPRQISGGQQQRVALARAVARRPRLLLLDEPLSALDAPTREQLRRDLRHWLAAMGVPTLLVTHDRSEALALGDQVVVMNQGQVCQSGPVEEVFSRPATLEVAGIVGLETVLAAEIVAIRGGLAEIDVGGSRLYVSAHGFLPGKTHLGIRAEEVRLFRTASAPSNEKNLLVGQVAGAVREGRMVRVSLDCGFLLTALLPLQTWTELGVSLGEQVLVRLDRAAVHLIPFNGSP